MVLILVGMPGCGKSTVGRHVARVLGWRFIDADVEIEHRLGHSIRAHFEQFGEPSFRDIETAVLADLMGQDRVVLATGGGAVLRPANRSHLKNPRARVVYLRATPEDLARRLRHDTQRPLLQGGDPLKKLRDLHAQRDPLYREVAHFTIDTGRASVPSISNLLVMQVELGGWAVLPQAPVSMEQSEACNGLGSEDPGRLS